MVGSGSGDDENGPEPADSAPCLFEGVVLSHAGQGLVVEGEDQQIRTCQTRRQLEQVTVGDRVLWSKQGDNQGRVEQLLPRRTLLTRPAHGGRIRPVAANLDQILVVVAPLPEPDWLLVDQYAAAGEQRDFDICIVINKIDSVDNTRQIDVTLDIYRKLGYPCLLVSARTGQGLDDLRETLKDKNSMLVGQSGVGKSSLTNALLPNKTLRTRELSEKAGLGRHTTTAAMLYHLPEGGDLIDSPGVAIFGLSEMTADDVAHGYREFREFLAFCQFNDCRHIQDKGCAIRDAVATGRIHQTRYERFLKLLTKTHLH